MKYKLVMGFLLLAVISFSKGMLISSTKEEYDKAKDETTIVKDNKLKKVNNTITINCKSIKYTDNNSENNNYQYDYIGNIGTDSNFIIIRKLSYNGSRYRLLNENCKEYKLHGKPHEFKNNIIVYNENGTTASKQFIELWRIRKSKLVKVKRISLKVDVIPVHVHMLNDKTFIFKDSWSKYWKVTF